MRVFATLTLTVGLTALVAGSASAQPPGGGRGGGFGPAGMLMMEAVQKELKLSDEQVADLRKVAEGMGAKMREKMQDAQGDREKMQAAFREMNEEAMKEIGKVLKPEQLKRFKELQHQQQGVLAAANNKELAGQLKLTDEQVSKIQKINEELRSDMNELRQSGGFGDPETMKKMQAARKEAMTKATAVLTNEQKKTWEEMTGKPFEFPAMGQRPGGRRPPGGNPPPGDKPKIDD
jgi:hypothetical protein